MKNKSPTQLYLSRIKPSGRASILSQLRHVCTHLNWKGSVETQPFHTLSYAQVESLKQARLVAGASSRTINHLLCAIRGITKIAFLSGQITEKPWLQIQSVKALKVFPSTRWNALASDEVCALLDTYRQERRLIPVRNTAILAVLLSTGLRRSELIALQVEQFNMDELAIEVLQGKGGKPRVQYMPEWAVKDLTAWLAIRGNEAGYLFNPFIGEEPQLTGHCPQPPSTTSLAALQKRWWTPSAPHMICAEPTSPSYWRRM